MRKSTHGTVAPQTTGTSRTNSGAFVFLLFFLIGAGILFYPKISAWLAEYNQVVAIQTYQAQVSDLSSDEKEAMWNKAVDYNERMTHSIVKDPFAVTENIDPFDEYFDTLDVGAGIMGVIYIPAIGVRLPIYHSTSDAVLALGVGHIKATALPIGGPSTHSVLTAHTGLRNANMFNDLVNLVEGDTFYIEVLDRTHAYQVDHIEVVQPDDISKLKVVESKDYITLVTCTPYGVNSHRLLVRGERVDYDADASIEMARRPFPWWVLIVILILVLIIDRIALWLDRRAKRRRDELASSSRKDGTDDQR